MNDHKATLSWCNIEDVSARMAVWAEDCRLIGMKNAPIVKCPHCYAMQLDPNREICGNKRCQLPVGPGKWLPDTAKPPPEMMYQSPFDSSNAVDQKGKPDDEDELFGF